MQYHPRTNITAYEIPDELADAYKGCGRGWAVIDAGKLVQIGYEADCEPPANAVTGMLSSWEFCREGKHTS